MPTKVRLRYMLLNTSIYLGYSGAGILSLFARPAAIANTLASAIGLAWAVLTAIGGVLGLIGVISGRLVFKLTGIPLLISATFGYGTVILARVILSHATSPLSSLVVVFMLYALSGHLAQRWLEIRRLLRAGGSDEL